MHKRDPRLHGLSHDHHRALVLSRRAKRADGASEQEQREVWTEVQQAFASTIGEHFKVEEQLLLPRLEELGESELVRRTLDEHERLRELASSESPRLSELGELLTAHVRFEEAELFHRAQELLSDADLESIDAARPADYA